MSEKTNSIYSSNQLENYIKWYKEGKLDRSVLFQFHKGAGEIDFIKNWCHQTLFCTEKKEWIFNPDILHIFPVNTSTKIDPVKRKEDLLYWQEYTNTQSLMGLEGWSSFYNKKNSLLQIGVSNAELLINFVRDKPYFLSKKIAIIWYAETMNESCANKILKLVEEPPKEVIVVFVTNQKDLLLQTIVSRLLPLFVEQYDVHKAVNILSQDNDVSKEYAQKILTLNQYNISETIHFLKADYTEKIDFFVKLMRTVFKAKLDELSAHIEVFVKLNRTDQKEYLLFCLRMLRMAYWINQGLIAEELVFDFGDFKFVNFAKFINEKNFPKIQEEIEKSIYSIERNATPKSVFYTMSIKLIRYFKIKT